MPRAGLSQEFQGILCSLIGSRKLNKVSIPAEALYIRLLLVCDDAGHFPAEPESVAAGALGRRMVNGSVRLDEVSGWLDELEDAGLIGRFRSEGGGEDVLQITQYRNFRRHKKLRYSGPLSAPAGPEEGPEVQVQVQVQEEVQVQVQKKPAPRRRPSGGHQEAISLWMNLWEEARGEPYAFQGGKDGTAVANALKYAQGDLGLLEERMRRLLFEPPGAWYAQNASLTLLASKWNELGTTVSRELTPEERRQQETRDLLDKHLGEDEWLKKLTQ